MTISAVVRKCHWPSEKSYIGFLPFMEVQVGYLDGDEEKSVGFRIRPFRVRELKDLWTGFCRKKGLETNNAAWVRIVRFIDFTQ